MGAWILMRIFSGLIAALTRWARWMGAGFACGHPA